VRKTNKGGPLIEAFEEILQQIQFRNSLQKVSGQGFSSPQAFYGPANSTLLAVAVRPLVQHDVD
jgi:hypothetical protein